MEPAPPAVTPIATTLILDTRIPAAMFLSYARLYAASWQHAYQHTDPLDFDRQLVPLLGVRRTQARHHLRMLRFARLLDWTSDHQNRYVVHFPPSAGALEKTDSVVVGGFNNINYIDSQQHQQVRESGDGARGADCRDGAQGAPYDGAQGADCGDGAQGAAYDGAQGADCRDGAQGAAYGASATHPTGEDVYGQALSYLRHAGVWEDVAHRLAERVERGQRKGDASLPGLADILGWIAYCFAEREKNHIAHPAAVLAANLNANRRCPEAYRPEPVCASCGYAGDYCQCEGEPAYHFPDEFLELAFSRSYFAGTGNRWQVCLLCHGFPCKCNEE